jgi:transcriptional regulator with XRE-family HTH domain
MTIKDFRLSQNLSQGELAEALGISVSSERSYEYGVRKPSAKVIEKIKEVYGVDLNETETAVAEAAPIVEEKPARRGRKKKDAVVALHQAPLTLTEAEMHELTRAEHHGYLHDEVERVWDYQYAKNGKFADLPWQAQTVIFSCIYQCGWAGFRRRGPATLRALEAHDWPRAVRNLKSGPKGWDGEYWQRRALEGSLLEELC